MKTIQKSITGDGTYDVIDNSKIFREDGTFNTPSFYVVYSGLSREEAKLLSRKLNKEQEGGR